MFNVEHRQAIDSRSFRAGPIFRNHTELLLFARHRDGRREVSQPKRLPSEFRRAGPWDDLFLGRSLATLRSST